MNAKKVLELKERHFPKGFRRSISNLRNRILNRTTERKLENCIARLGIDRGAVICIHSMLSGLGYIVGGPKTVIKSVQKAVPQSTIMMPTFPFGASCEAYLSNSPVYHVDRTPSKSGLLSEELRLMAGAERSLHPTHPCTALGPKAGALIQGTEDSRTPFGDGSTYGRFSEMDEAVLLLIHTNSTSIVHRIQEMVNMPNLFLEKSCYARGYDKNNDIKEYEVKVHTPRIPLYWVLPGDTDSSIEYIWSPDYSLYCPDYNRTRMFEKLRSRRAKEYLLERHKYFLEKGIYRIEKIGNAEIMAVTVKPWIERICHDLSEGITTYSHYYSLEEMRKADRDGLLTK